jgi:hypothetical protein
MEECGAQRPHSLQAAWTGGLTKPLKSKPGSLHGDLKMKCWSLMAQCVSVWCLCEYEMSPTSSCVEGLVPKWSHYFGGC